MIGKTLGHYEVTGELGKGGMGEVYRARDTKLGREVAIKVLPAEFAGDPDRLARFEREAKLLASLNHPNIAGIYGLEKDEGTRFLALELVEGDTLAERLARGPVPLAECLKLALQILEALEGAHENGVIHRDLKPANIKITPDGKVKVLDFGLAKAFLGDESDVNVSNSPTLSMQATQQGLVLGTAAYMSPEQAKGVAIDKRTDIFSFGCVLFEMLTGRQAFNGELVTEILASVLAREPDYGALRPDLNPRLDALLRRCLEKDAKKRWHDAGDVRVEIEQVLGDPEGSVVTPAAAAQPAGLRASLPWALAALVVGGILFGSAAWLLKPAPPVEPGAVVRFFHPLIEEDFTRGGRPLVDVSRDGTQLAYVANGELWLRNLEEAEARPVVGTDSNPSTPAFSPDGENLAFWSSENELQRIPVAGGTPVTIAPAVNPFGISWSDDDTILYGAEDGVWRVPATGGAPERIVEIDGAQRIHGPRLLPGGTHLLYSLSQGTNWDEAEIVVQDLATRDRTTVWTGGNDARYVPSGHLVYAFEGDIFALRFDLDALSVSGGQVSMVSGVDRGGTNTGTAHYALSDSGTLVHVPGLGGTNADTRRLAFIDREGNAEILPADLGAYGPLRLSPDQNRIAVEVVADDGSADIWIYEIDEDVINRLTFSGGRAPEWTPDGSEITFLGDGSLWNIRADFSGGLTELAGTAVDALAGPASWSTDGVLLFSAGGEIYAWTRETEMAELLVERPLDGAGVALFPVFSPDGRWFVYMSSETGRPELYAFPYPLGTAGRQTVTTNGGTISVWPRESGELLQFNGDTLTMEAIGITTDPSWSRRNPVELFGAFTQGFVWTVGGNSQRWFDATADGQRFVGAISVADAGGGAGETDDPGAFRRVNVILNWTEELKERLPVD